MCKYKYARASQEVVQRRKTGILHLWLRYRTHHLLDALHIDAEVVVSAPLHQMFHPLSVFWLVIFSDASHCSVIHKPLYDSWGVLPSSYTSAGWTGGDSAHSPGVSQCWTWWRRRWHCGFGQSEGLLVRKSQFPSVGIRPRRESFCTRVCGMMVLKAEGKFRKSRQT